MQVRISFEISAIDCRHAESDWAINKRNNCPPRNEVLAIKLCRRSNGVRVYSCVVAFCIWLSKPLTSILLSGANAGQVRMFGMTQCVKIAIHQGWLTGRHLALDSQGQYPARYERTFIPHECTSPPIKPDEVLSFPPDSLSRT